MPNTAVGLKSIISALCWGPLIGIGLTSNVVFAFQAATWGQFFAVGTVGLMYSAASLLLECFIGFLFGIPRTFQQNPSKPTTTDPDKAASPGFDYRPNTNLEQISDWLTKILVGVGLTQVTSISVRIEAISIYMVTGLEAAERKKLKDVIEDQRSGGPGKWITSDSDRWGLSERILARL